MAAASPFVAPDVIALLCRNNVQSIPPLLGNANMSQNPVGLTQGKQEKPNARYPKKKQSSNIEKESFQTTGSQNTSRPQNASRRYNPRHQGYQFPGYDLDNQFWWKGNFQNNRKNNSRFPKKNMNKQKKDVVEKVEKNTVQISKEDKHVNHESAQENHSLLISKEGEPPESALRRERLSGFKLENAGAIPKLLSRSSSLTTVNDSSERKIKMSLHSRESKLHLLIVQSHFVNNLQTIKTFIEDNYTNDTVGIVVQESFEMMLKKNSHSRDKIGTLISELMEFNLISNHHVVEGLTKFYQEAVVTAETCPLMWTWLAELTVPMIISDSISFLDLCSAGKTYLKTKHVKNMLIPVFQLLIEKQGTGLLQNRWKSSGVTLSDFIAQNEIESFIKENKLEFLIEQQPSTLDFVTERRIQTILDKFMNRKEHFENVSQFVMESLMCIENVFVNSATHDVLSGIFSSEVMKDESSAEFVGHTLSDLIGFQLIDPEIAAKRMSIIFDGYDIEQNPQTLQLMAQVFAHLLITKRFSYADIYNATSPILKTPPALDFFLKLFELVLKADNIASVESDLRSSKISLYNLVDPAHVKDLVKLFGFHISEQKPTEGQFHNELDVRQELVEMIKSCEKVEDIHDWISVHVGTQTKDRAFIRDLISAVSEGVTSKGLNVDQFNKYKHLISNFIKIDNNELATLLDILKLITSDNEAPVEEKGKLAETSSSEPQVEQRVGHQEREFGKSQVSRNSAEVKNTTKAVPLSSKVEQVKQQGAEVNNCLLEEQKQVGSKQKDTTDEQKFRQEEKERCNSPVVIKNPANIKLTIEASSSKPEPPQQTLLNVIDTIAHEVTITQGQNVNKEIKDQSLTSTKNQKENNESTSTQNLDQMMLTIVGSMKKGTHFRHLKSSIDENLGEVTKESRFIKTLVECILESSFGTDLKTLKLENIQYYGKLLKLYTEGNAENEIVALCTFQDFLKLYCESQDVFEKVFDTLWMEEFISEQAFLDFMDTKIKGDVLKSLAGFYDKLMKK